MSESTVILPWFPLDCAEWEVRTRDLTLEEEGALVRLCQRAWRDPIPCTIGNTPASWERILGARWRKLRALVEQHFTVVPDQPGRLRCAWLFALYEVQLRKHLSAQQKGKLGGRPRRTPTEAQEEAQGIAQEKAQVSPQPQQKVEGSNPGPLRATGVTPPAASGAPALREAPRAAAAAEPPATGGGVAARDVVPGEPPEDPAAARERELRAEYEAQLAGSVQGWCDEHEDEARDLERTLRGKLGLPPMPRELGRTAADVLGAALREIVREQNRWPTFEAWRDRGARRSQRAGAAA